MMAYQTRVESPHVPSMPEWQEILGLASKSTRDAHAAYVAARDEFADADAALTIPPLSAAHVRREGERRQAIAFGRVMASVATGDLTANNDLDEAEERVRVARRAASRAAKAYDAAARTDDVLVSKLDTERRKALFLVIEARADLELAEESAAEFSEALIRLRHKRDDLVPLIREQIVVDAGNIARAGDHDGRSQFGVPAPRRADFGGNAEAHAMQAASHEGNPNLTPRAHEMRPRVSTGDDD